MAHLAVPVAPPQPRVMVVEDNALLALALASLLRSAGYEPIVADSAAAARVHLLVGLPDIILMDVQMPGTNGYDFTREIRANPATATIPIVITSVRNLAEDRQMGFDAGCDEYVEKPFKPREMAPLLSRLMADRAAGVHKHGID
ncbi:MAG: hypothetical protein NVSMB17_03270 [Candidatus Dormibacteria bacterium]